MECLLLNDAAEATPNNMNEHNAQPNERGERKKEKSSSSLEPILV